MRKKRGSPWRHVAPSSLRCCRCWQRRGRWAERRCMVRFTIVRAKTGYIFNCLLYKYIWIYDVTYIYNKYNYIYIYIYLHVIYVHTHTYIHIYIYIYICMYVSIPFLDKPIWDQNWTYLKRWYSRRFRSNGSGDSGTGPARSMEWRAEKHETRGHCHMDLCNHEVNPQLGAKIYPLVI